MEKQETVGSLIRKLRELRDISQTELAEAVHIPRASLAAIETGRIDRPDRDRLEAIADVLDVDPRLLLQAAGYRVRGTPEPFKERTLADVLEEAARIARRLQDSDDPKDRAMLKRAGDWIKPVVFARELSVVSR